MAYPQNFFQNMDTGDVTDLGPSYAGGLRNLVLDYANPIEVAGVGKGWRPKNDPFSVYNAQGEKIADLGNDMAATLARREQELKFRGAEADLLNKQLEAQKRQRELTLPPNRPMDARVEREREQAGIAQERVGGLLSDLYGHYQALQQQGAVVDNKQSTMRNVGARVAASDIGQFFGGAIGTKAQETRDKIVMSRPMLINEIRNATGMSAKAMDSNVELKFYLEAATDPTRSIEANYQALGYLDRAYAGGRLGIASRKGAAQQPQTAQPSAATAPTGTYPQTGMRQGGNPTPVSALVNGGRDLTPPGGGRGDPREDALIQEGMDAINRGADPVAVRDRLRQMGVQIR